MTQIGGQQTLKDVFHRLSYPERKQLSQDLKQIISQLRMVPNQTPYRFANTLDGALVDHRGGRRGPFNLLSDFNYHLFPERASDTTRNAFSAVHSRQHRSFFTHSDLYSTNIIICQGRLAGIVD
ncbi:uncharacterized protein BJX67DRAFT_238800 [Aspergillus lucknowensis]|uniref:Aminoglycoside phosphotransferase domain-containing protein n=1 Tax=Aspergillus lucknowensis TaxID=176173 RepID=A0ABR4LGT3_9EURO